MGRDKGNALFVVKKSFLPQSTRIYAMFHGVNCFALVFTHHPPFTICPSA